MFPSPMKKEQLPKHKPKYTVFDMDARLYKDISLTAILQVAAA